MSVPDAQFKDIIDSIQQLVKDTIESELKKVPQSASPVAALPMALDDFREQLLEAVRDELRVLKEEILLELAQQIALTPTFAKTTPEPAHNPQKKSAKSWLDKPIF